ncbi:MAG: transcriptional repressor [bacterium]|nr:transcriptional repressor [bacterium]
MTALLDETRLSKNHRLVYEIVQEQGYGRHLPMSELYELARTRRPGIGFTTVYRALTRLRDLGMVSEITLPGADSAYYEAAGPEHAHFRCTECGTIDNVKFSLPSDLSTRVASDLGAHVTDSVVTLLGRCRACSTASVAI